jgi:hypothetical protein
MLQKFDEPLTHTLQVLDYQFVYAPGSISSTVPTAEGDEGQPRRDETDISNSYSLNSDKE